MSNAEWYARRLGKNRPPPPRATPPTGPAPPVRIPPASSYTGEQQPAVEVTAENLAEVAALWKGGQGTKTENQKCPNCSSDLYFSRSNGTGEGGGSGAKVYTQNGMATVAPRCYACGYTPAMPLQAGSG